MLITCISIYSPLLGSTYIELPRRLKNSMKGLINIKNNNNNCFLFCHIRHLNPLKMHPERIKKADKNMVNDVDYEGIEFPISKKILARLKKRRIFEKNIWKEEEYLNLHYYANNMVYPAYVSNGKL